MAQNLSDIKALLASVGLRPKHRLGQNFLHDANHMTRIVDAAKLSDGQLVLEIGAGTGALSERLLDTGATLVAVEIDSDLQPILRQRLDAYGDRATLLFCDILASKHRINPLVLDALKQILDATSPPHEKLDIKLVANLPYHVASPVIANFFTSTSSPVVSTAIVMVQREVADRLTASPCSKAYGPLTVIVQAMGHIERLATLSPRCFWPQPEIESSVIRIRRRQRPLTEHVPALTHMLHRLFHQRRKQLGTILGRDRELPHGIDESARPEQLTIEQIVALSQWAR